ncbi:MAG: NYN domain-containing protein [Spirochaetaceae bacterium]|nr:NYN domain-containing protein [Spirochaetaceae bacterium]
MNNNVAILWDLENVTPTSSNTLFLDGMSEYVEGIGSIVCSYAYADWSKPGFRSLGPLLAARNFYMVHIPRARKTKNSADMQLVSDALDLLRYYDNIDTYVLITGDSDFRPLLLSLKKTGKKIHIICDIKTAAQDLLIIADSFIDYREVLTASDDSDDSDEDELDEKPADNKPNHPKEYWFERLAESASLLQSEEKTCNMGTVKIKLKMLNRDFNENTLGYKRWSAFVTAAVKAGYVRMEELDKQTNILPGQSYRKDVGSLQSALRILIEELKELDNGKNADFHQYSILNSKLLDKGINTKNLGFTKFKKFISSAEARGLVETKVENLENFVKRQI